MISPHAVVLTDAIGPGVKIAEFAVVRQGTRLGKDVTIHPHVTIEPGVHIEDGVGTCTRSVEKSRKGWARLCAP